MQKLIRNQFIILLVGTIFAWFNLGYEFYNYFNNKPCDLGCAPTAQVVNPIYTPCFYGAMFFLLALSYSWQMLKKNK